MGGKVTKGTEHGVEWEIDATKFDPVIISVKSIKTGKEEKEIYKCQYKPIFGYDVCDTQEVNKILDDLIVKYADDGYKGLNDL